jgi:hypothetical protein
MQDAIMVLQSAMDLKMADGFEDEDAGAETHDGADEDSEDETPDAEDEE